jgi:hypothetical protein
MDLDGYELLIDLPGKIRGRKKVYRCVAAKIERFAGRDENPDRGSERSCRGLAVTTIPAVSTWRAAGSVTAKRPPT